MHTMMPTKEAQATAEHVARLETQCLHLTQLLAVLVLTSEDQRLVVPTDKLTAWPITPWRLQRTVEDGRVVLTVATDETLNKK